MIDWKKNSLAWQMGSRIITVQGLQEPHSPRLVSSLFQRSGKMDLVSVQRMRKLARKEPVFVIMVRPTNEDSANEEDPSNQAQDQFIVAVGQDQTKTPYPE